MSTVVNNSFTGLSLRDTFAGQALNAYIAGCIAAGHAWSPKEAAKDAYVIADAVLAERVAGVDAMAVRNDSQVLHLMVQQGGAFVHHIARAWLSADPENRTRLAAAFADVYDRYATQVQATASSQSEVSA